VHRCNRRLSIVIEVSSVSRICMHACMYVWHAIPSSAQRAQMSDDGLFVIYSHYLLLLQAIQSFTLLKFDDDLHDRDRILKSSVKKSTNLNPQASSRPDE